MVWRLIVFQFNLQVGECQNWLHLEALTRMVGMAASRSFDKNGWHLGIGKTTLAQLAYNNDDVKNHFEKRIWVCVSDPFDEFRIARSIIEALTGSAPDVAEFQSLMQHIQEFVEGEKFLFVLDDVWNEDYCKWEPFYYCFKNCLYGSKILITTRKETVACIMGSTDVISVNVLSEMECWSVFESLAFFGNSMEERENLEKIGREIIRKCKGLPLAAKTIASLLRSKNTEKEWKNILESEIWELEEVEKGLLAPLMLSYYELPSKVKQCFAYCAVFPKDHEILKYDLIELWMAQGYFSEKGYKEMKDIGEKYFNILASRSFFQDFAKSGDGEIICCKMHDLVHDFARYISSNECSTIEIHGGEESAMSPFGEKKILHLMLTLYSGALVPISIWDNVKGLRSLLVDCDEYSWSSEVLPQLFDKLTCLRALKLKWTHSLRFLSVGIGELIRLRGVSRFVLGGGNDRACGLESLKKLNLLRACSIYGLGGVSDGGKAAKAELEKKKYLFYLRLRFDDLRDGDEEQAGRRENEEDEDERLLDALGPPPNLKNLAIRKYRGRRNVVPRNWVMSLTNLRALVLKNCRNCEHLPPLGKLPSLEDLEICRMESVKRVGHEFLGVESDTDGSSVIVFPKLKYLKFYDMEELEEWDYGTAIKGEIIIMPRLSFLEIGGCQRRQERTGLCYATLPTSSLIEEFSKGAAAITNYNHPRPPPRIAAIAAVCVQPEADYRPLMTDVVQSLIPLVKKNATGATSFGSSRFQHQTPSPRH
ncbi:hypothetical protein WN944_007500 [Citrus x changshan-huyou]|uniref:NB-ARC domain-containing protein n=1 Tax=Citrus x changshan-huyou TaxID=2935761 RepID=A0AAP0MRA1_9ROSI